MGMMAQKKQLSQARDILKEGKHPEKAESLMMELLKDSANRNNIKIWNVLFNAQTMRYEQYNEKIYVQKGQDTLALFNTASKMFISALAIDSIDAMPDAKGRVVPKYRQHNASYLNVIRPNLFNGGVYLIKKNKLNDAIPFFEQYIDCARRPLFAAYDYSHNDRYLSQAAYWAMYCSNQLGYYDDVLAYYKFAINDTLHLSSVLQYCSEALYHKSDTDAYVSELHKGFEMYPTHPYFFPRLVEYYGQSKQYDNAMQVVDKALETDSTNTLFRFAKSNVCLNTKRYDECIAICDKLLAEGNQMADAYYNAGLAYFNKAIDIEKKLMSSHKSRTQRKQCQEQREKFYRQSLSYLDTYRYMAPDKQSLWSVPLYTIYLSLNMGAEFEEIEKLRH